jgi:hypothetical protein
MEDKLKKKDDELNNVLDGERSKTNAVDLERKEWDETRASLENKLAEAQELNESLKRELDRLQSEHANELRRLREDLEDARQLSSSNAKSGGAASSDLEKENQALRAALEEQEQVTEEVRREAQEFLREMRMISQQSGAAWEKQSELEKTIDTLENEVREWQNRYARAKTQLRDMRGSSAGLTVDQDAAKYVRDKGFMQENGLVKDIHVTKFQIAIDDLLQRARVGNPERLTDSMKAVVASVRRITKDVDGPAQSSEMVTQHQKLKARVSAAANNLITTSKNFASSAGITPVSIVDAAASHLVAAVVELLRAAKIRFTPADELEEDDDGTVTPVESTSFFSPRSNGQSQISSVTSVQDSLPPPPPFQGLGAGSRTSIDSSAYSPVNSPRESYANGSTARNGATTNGNEGGYGNMARNLAAPPNGMRAADRRTEDLKIYLEDQTAVLVQTIQELVQLIRNDADINQVSEEINTIVEVVGQVIAETTAAAGPSGAQEVKRLASCRERLMEAGKRGLELAGDNNNNDTKSSREWRMWTQTLPPIAFELARETKELVQRVDQLQITGLDDGVDDFA